MRTALLAARVEGRSDCVRIDHPISDVGTALVVLDVAGGA
jgi:hypothetical protein